MIGEEAGVVVGVDETEVESVSKTLDKSESESDEEEKGITQKDSTTSDESSVKV